VARVPNSIDAELLELIKQAQKKLP
jgi:hypothetical protein